MKKLCFIFLLLLGISSCEKKEHFSPEHSSTGAGGSSGQESSEKNKNETGEGGESAERPSDLDLALHAIVTWDVEPEVYLDKINVVELEQEPESFTMEQLKGLVKIAAVTYDKGVYKFADEDFLDIRLVNVKWNRTQQKIEFKLAYKNIIGRTIQSLPFNLTDYYAVRFNVNSSFVKTHYLQGVYQYAGSFLGSLLSFDAEKYLPELYSKGIDVRHNTMTITFSVHDRKTNRDLGIKVTKELKGFKPQRELLKAMVIGATAAVHDQAVEVMARYDNKRGLKEYLENKILTKKWMQQMEYGIDNQPLFYSEQQSDKYSRPVEVISGKGSRLDVYLENPIWRLDAAELDGKNLKLRVRLKHVNHTDLIDVSYDIVIPNVSNNRS